MPAQQQKQVKGGKNLSTSENKKARYKAYAITHGMKEHRFTVSKEHRGCGPLAKYNRRKALEVQAVENSKKDRHPQLSDLPLTDASLRALAWVRFMGVKPYVEM